jgi:hypothetical protein
MRALTTRDLRCPVTHKQAYLDEATALEYLEKAWTRKDWDPKKAGHTEMPKRVYQCNDCGWWHMTSKGA